MSLNPNRGIPYEEYAHRVALLVHERSTLSLEDAERAVGDVSDMRNAAYTVDDAASEILAHLVTT